MDPVSGGAAAKVSVPDFVSLVADIVEGLHLLLALARQEKAGADHDEAVILLHGLGGIVAPRKQDGCGDCVVQLQGSPCAQRRLCQTVRQASHHRHPADSHAPPCDSY